MEDGTKISKRIEYDAVEKVVLGLVSPLQKKTGMPREKFFSAQTAKQIVDAVQKNQKASYLQVILAKPNVKGTFFGNTFLNTKHKTIKFSFIISSAPFLLGFYATDNKFTSKDVTIRTLYIKSELERKRGIKVICSGSDGDLKFMKSQKKLFNFGSIKSFGPTMSKEIENKKHNSTFTFSSALQK